MDAYAQPTIPLPTVRSLSSPMTRTPIPPLYALTLDPHSLSLHHQERDRGGLLNGMDNSGRGRDAHPSRPYIHPPIHPSLLSHHHTLTAHRPDDRECSPSFPSLPFPFNAHTPISNLPQSVINDDDGSVSGSDGAAAALILMLLPLTQTQSSCNVCVSPSLPASTCQQPLHCIRGSGGWVGGSSGDGCVCD